MMNSNKPSEKAEKILEDAIANISGDDSLEFHLPESVTKLDKSAILAILYQVISAI